MSNSPKTFGTHLGQHESYRFNTSQYSQSLALTVQFRYSLGAAITSLSGTHLGQDESSYRTNTSLPLQARTVQCVYSLWAWITPGMTPIIAAKTRKIPRTDFMLQYTNLRCNDLQGLKFSERNFHRAKKCSVYSRGNVG